MSRTTLAVTVATALSSAALTPALALVTADQAPRHAGSHTHAAAGAAAGHTSDLATVAVRGVDGRRLGGIWLRQTSEGVQVSARLRGLAPGFHGFHVHAAGACDPESSGGPFTTAGGHYPGSTGEAHAAHAGDMPSLFATADGRAHAVFVTDRFSLEELMDADGSAVMVHAGADNFANVPDRYTSSLSGAAGPDAETLKGGDSGSRFACGVVAGPHAH